MPSLSLTTAERLAACASVGLHYWSDSPAPNVIWANGDDMRFHLVRLDRVTRTAHHVCGMRYETPGMMETRRCWYGQRIGQWPELRAASDRTLNALDDLTADLRCGSEGSNEATG